MLATMDAAKIRLAKENESYLATLYGKALDAHVDDAILGDTFAADVVRRIDFDFAKLKLPKNAEISLPLRAKHLDGWTREFLAANPAATVLHLGCGLDSRVFRIDPPATVRWYDVDLPDVIALRRRLYPSRPSYELVGSSVTDLAWLDGVPHDQPVIVVAEGLVMYLPEHEGLALFNRITGTFPSGQLVFDAYSRLMTRLVMFGLRSMSTPVRLRWGIDDPRLLEKKVARLALVDAVPFLTMPELVARLVRTRMQRASFRLMERLALVKRAVVHVRYRF
jgi:O-methyltransferase involved in polyketide biosynthesis